MSQRQPDPEQQMQRQRQMQSESTAEQTAHSVAAGGIDVNQFRRKEFVESITEPDIERDPEHLPEGEVADLEQKLSAEFGKHTVLGFISNDEWRTQYYKDKYRAILTKLEYRPMTGPGHKCSGIEYELLTGQEDTRPVLTPDRSRQINSAFEERTNARSLAINGRAFRGVTEVTAVSKSERLGGDGSEPSGILGRAKAVLGG